MTMSEKKVALILNHMVEQGAPGAEINLWPALQARLQTSKLMPRKGSKMDTHITSSHRLRIAALITLSIALLVGVLLATPQGQAWAQNLLRFFTRSGDVLPLPPWSTTTPVAMVNVTPGISQAMQKPSATFTITPTSGIAALCGDFMNPIPNCSVSQIRKMVSFPVKALSVVPAGLTFVNATWLGDGVAILYKSDDNRSSLFIIQKPDTHKADQAWAIPDSVKVETVQIGNTTGEYVIGGWSNYAGDKVATWDANSGDQTLRWEEDNNIISMSLTGSQYLPGTRLDKDGLARLASEMTTQADASAPLSTLTPTLISTQGVEEVEKHIGFKVIQPGWLPKDYHLDHTSISADGKAVCLEYHHPADFEDSLMIEKGYSSLSIAESAPGSLPALADLIPFNADPKYFGYSDTETVKIGGAKNGQAIYARGILEPSKLCGNRYEDQVLSVQTDTLQFIILSRTDPGNGHRNFVTRQQNMLLAESITGLSTIPADQLDPEFITSLTDAERLFGAHIKLPTQLPDGKYFDHFSFQQVGIVKSIYAYFGGGGNPFSVVVTAGGDETLDKLYNERLGVYDKVKVRGTDGIISQGVFLENGFKMMENGGDGGANLVWFEDGLEYTIGGFNAYPRSVWLQIAESMK